MKKETSYYLMRHADYETKNSNQFLTYNGILRLKEQMDRLGTELQERHTEKTKLRIIHSLLPRAHHTAILAASMLYRTKWGQPRNCKIHLQGDDKLNSDRLRITEEYVNKTVSECEKENEICMILSHQPDIEAFTKDTFGTSEYRHMKIVIEEVVPNPEQEEDDDLPF